MLHLSLDGAATFERTIDAKAGQEMVFTLLRAPQLTRLEVCASLTNQSVQLTTAQMLDCSMNSTMDDLSLLIGRNTALLMKLSGTHLVTAQGRVPSCVFHHGGGRTERMAAEVVDDSTITCLTPHISATRDVSR